MALDAKTLLRKTGVSKDQKMGKYLRDAVKPAARKKEDPKKKKAAPKPKEAPTKSPLSGKAGGTDPFSKAIRDAIEKNARPKTDLQKSPLTVGPYTKDQVIALLDWQRVQDNPALAGDPMDVSPDSPGAAVRKSVTGGLKKTGVTALKGLSVPQAILYTTLQKSPEWRGRTGKDVSWKNLAGDFHDGYRGGRGVLKDAGIDSKWGGLALDIGLDPLNLVGVGVAKKAATAKTASDIFKATKQGAKARAALSADDKKALAKALTTKSSGATSDKKKAALVRAFGSPDKGLKDSELKAVFDAKNKTKRTKYEAPANSGFVDAARPASDVTFAPGGILDKAGLPTNTSTRVKQLVEAQKGALDSGGPRQLALRVGIGRDAKQVKLPIKLKEKSLKRSTKSNWFVLRPAEKLGHALARTASEVGQGIDNALVQYSKTLGLKDSDSAIIHTVGTLTNQNKEAGDKLRNVLTEAEVWTPRHQEALDYVQSRGRIMAQEDRSIGRTWTQKMEDYNVAMRQATTQAERDKLTLEIGMSGAVGKGEYWPQTISKETEKALTKERRADIAAGKSPPISRYMEGRGGTPDPHFERVNQNPFEGMTEAQFRELMGTAGVQEPVAKTLSETVAETLGFAPNPQRMADSPSVILGYEFNAFHALAEREKAHLRVLMNQEIEQLIGEGIPRHIFERAAAGPMMNTALGRRIQTGVAFMKAWFTSFNLFKHYLNNMWGDLVNRNIGSSGGIRNLSLNANMPGSAWWNLAKGDPKEMSKIFRVGDKEYTGAELSMMSRFAGLGRGYVGADIQTMVDILHSHKVIGWPARMNLHREDSQRLQTYVNHLRKGDDPFNAGIKTLKVHFDYNELTDVERVILRNVLFFYTWMKRNGMLQAEVLAARPGVYAAFGDMEARGRTHYEDEPEYFGEQGAVPIPGTNRNFPFANPMTDIYKADLTQAGLRKNVLSPVNPLLRVPTEILTNKQFFTGAPVSNYNDANTPYWLAGVANALGVDTPTVDGKPAMNSSLSYALKNILGPQGGVIQAGYDDSATGKEQLARALGLAVQPIKPEKWAKNKKIREQQRKADATRKRNAEKK